MKITVLDLSHLVLGGKKYFEIIYDENEAALCINLATLYIKCIIFSNRL